MFPSNTFRPTLNAMEDRMLLSVTASAALHLKPLTPAGDIAIVGNPNGGTVADDVIVDGRIITAENPTTATTHELGHTLGFRHEHTRPDVSTAPSRHIGHSGDDVLIGGLGQDDTGASAPYQGKRSTSGYVPT